MMYLEKENSEIKIAEETAKNLAEKQRLSLLDVSVLEKEKAELIAAEKAAKF